MSSSHLPILCGTPAWTISGVNVFLATLARTLRGRGVDARVLLSNADPTRDAPFPRPDDLPVDCLDLRRDDSMLRRWKRLRAYLEQHAPCVYLPGWDLEAAAIVPTLPPEVRVVGILHSDDPWYYGMTERLGPHLDAFVCVSRYIEDRLRIDHPELASRCRTIPYGLAPVPPPPPRSLDAAEPLRLVYAGRLIEHQKRVLDIPRVLAATAELGVPVALDVVGDGQQADAFRRAAQPFLERGSVRLHGALAHDEVLALYERADVVLLTSNFEGFPISLLEAMSRGCVPVVSDLCSGVPELVEDGVTGFRVRVGDFRAFAERLARLARDRGLLAALSEKSAMRIHEGEFTAAAMTDRYQALFAELAGSPWRRPPGPIVLPSGRRIRWTDHLPGPLLRPLRRFQRAARRVRTHTD